MATEGSMVTDVTGDAASEVRKESRRQMSLESAVDVISYVVKFSLNNTNGPGDLLTALCQNSYVDSFRLVYKEDTSKEDAHYVATVKYSTELPCEDIEKLKKRFLTAYEDVRERLQLRLPLATPETLPLDPKLDPLEVIRIVEGDAATIPLA